MGAPLNVEVSPLLLPTLQPARYKILKGGRGSGKSWHVARMLILQAYHETHRVLCCREIQKSIQESVLALLAKQVELFGLQDFFTVQKNAIYGKNGSVFIFEGLRSNIQGIKSMEGITRVWVEEAQTVTKTSWDTLIPTIRAENSEIWVTFNPYDELDDTYQRFVVEPPPGTINVHIDYLDNPNLDSANIKEAEHLKLKNKAMYEHIWLGQCMANKDGAYYAQILIDHAEHQIRIPVDSSLPVHTAWDLGMADNTAIWFYQQHGDEVRLVGYYENNNQGLNHYINYLHEWRTKHSAVYGMHYAPHDITVRELGTGKSRAEVARKMGINFQTVPRLGVQEGINAARALLTRCWFDKEATQEGLRCLRNYRKEFDERKGVFNPKPLHDFSSHGADAFRYLAVSIKKARNSQAVPIQAAGFDVF